MLWVEPEFSTHDHPGESRTNLHTPLVPTITRCPDMPRRGIAKTSRSHHSEKDAFIV